MKTSNGKTLVKIVQLNTPIVLDTHNKRRQPLTAR